MSVPWLRLLDLAIGVTSLVRRRAGRPDRHAGLAAGGGQALLSGLGSLGSGPLEARLVGAVVAALKEAFDRDHTRLELEREQVEAERRRAERALRLELLRQAGERELGRLRLLAGLALASWLGTLFFAAGLAASGVGRAALGLGWVLLLGALGAAFSGLARVARALDRIGDHLNEHAETKDVVSLGSVAATAPWLLVAGLTLVAVGVLLG